MILMSLKDLKNRCSFIGASWIFVVAMMWAHANYLNTTWGYYGFSYNYPSLLVVGAIFFLVNIASVAMPVVLVNPSSIILLLLYLVVYLPTVVITLCLGEFALERYWYPVMTLGITFCLICVVVRRFQKDDVSPGHLPTTKFTNFILLTWVLCCLILILTYGSVIRFASLEEVYDQRAAAAGSGLISYVKSYFSSVLSPALLAIGLVKKRKWLIAAGLIGFLLFYSITAQRTYFLLPIIMIGLHRALKLENQKYKMSAIPILFAAIVVFVSVLFEDRNIVASLSSVYIVFRTFGLPGLSFSQYYDLFSNEGYTWWSHIKIIDLFVSAPLAFRDSSLWPGLGYIVGERYYGDSAVNANANLFSGDGLAAAGELGILVIGAVFSAWLVLLDRVSVQWDKAFVLLTTLAVGFALTNGHFFTSLLSFGGIFWTAVFYIGNRRVIFSPNK